MDKKWQKTIFVIIFAIFFGLLEAVAVIHLRKLFGSGNTPTNYIIGSQDVLLSLGLITFLKPFTSTLITNSQELLKLEWLREASTILMLIMLALTAGQKIRDRLAYFLLAFATWDIFYYVFLKILTNWPATLLDQDIFFLIPVAWAGPVITPLIISCIVMISTILLLAKKQKNL